MHRIDMDEEDSEDDGSYEQHKRMLGDTWEAIGPFPAGMREHPMFASPLHAFGALDCDRDLSFASQAYDENETWPSELGKGGRVGWKRFEEDDDGWVRLTYPEVEWNQLRSDHGWASLQYQVVLRTSLSVAFVIPMPGVHLSYRLQIDARQLTEFAIIPKDQRGPEIPLKWYHGDMYDFAGSPSGQSDRMGRNSKFSRAISLPAGEYTIIARAIYEIRLFGDPGNKPPTIEFRFDVGEDVSGEYAIAPVFGSCIVPDVVDGLFMGDYMSVGVRVPASRARTIVDAARADIDGVKVTLLEKTMIESGQTRMLVLKVEADRPMAEQTSAIPVILSCTRDQASSIEFCIMILLRHRSRHEAFKITFPSPSIPKEGLPAQIGFSMVRPPTFEFANQQHKAKDIPVILALHGAGVDVEWETWINAIPQTGGWAVLPTGKNEWGEDWHGASMADAWAARDSLPRLLARLKLEVTDRTLLIGHSNGGQGAWHLAARYPDRIVGVIGAAGYLKIQDYVPYSELTGHHHADPALMGILLSSLTPYNNDLHLSNLVHIPCLALHGGSDDNVPPRHSRSYANIISSWQHDKHAVEVVEVPGKGHWWDDMFQHPKVRAFIDRVLAAPPRSSNDERKRGFTLTCATPEENGGRAGIRIVELDTPGRIARLDVNAPHWRQSSPVPGLDLRGMNIKRIEMSAGGQAQILRSQEDGTFTTENDLYQPRAYGPMIRILSSSGPLHFVVGTDGRHTDLAVRLAHDTLTHHRLDSVILDPKEALELVAAGRVHGNLVVIGRPSENIFADWLLRQARVPVSFPASGILKVADRTVYENGSGIISLLPHPTNPAGLALLLAGNDPAGLETAARLFPIRTGVPVPDWVVVGPRMAWQAAGGIIGAGFWDDQWKWSGKMSWFDR